MRLRRALLLFAIVLSLAAMVTSLSQPPQPSRHPKGVAAAPATPTARPGPSRHGPEQIKFDEGRAPVTKELTTDRPATVTVKVQEPGMVELQGLGLTLAAQPLTPARFDVLVAKPGHHEVLLTPAGGKGPRTVGRLRVHVGR